MTNPKGSHNSYITLSDAELYTRINQARKDERDTLIGTLEKWLPDNKFDNFDGGEAIGLTDLTTKLNELRKEGIV